jgi:Collagen triple helix repeat (20 copies)
MKNHSPHNTKFKPTLLYQALLSSTLVLSGCGGGGFGDSTAGAPGLNIAARFIVEPPGANCATGGNRFQTGPDLNSNNALDDKEVTATSYLCNALSGATGAAGATGATGAQGPTGATGAVGATGAIGATGATGAIGAVGGPGAVGAIGATGTTGATGPAGATGATGAPGATGADGPIGATGLVGTTGAVGPAGPNGPSLLIRGTELVPGFSNGKPIDSRCPLGYGGILTEIGLDTSLDGFLSAGEVTSSTVRCRDANGRFI